MGNKCCNEKGNNDGDVAKRRSSSFVLDIPSSTGKMIKRPEEELTEGHRIHEVTEFKTHPRNDKGKIKRSSSHEKKKQALLKLRTETEFEDEEKKKRQLSFEVREICLHTDVRKGKSKDKCDKDEFLCVANQSKRGNLLKQPEGPIRRISTACVRTDQIKLIRAESDMVISLERKMTVGLAPSHFRRENKNEMAGKYDILEPIGKGAYGEVKTIRDKTTGQVKAVKIMPKETCKMSQNFVDEIKILQKLVRDL